MFINNERSAPFVFEPAGRLIDAMRQAGDSRLCNLAAGVPDPDILPGEEMEQAFQTVLANHGNKPFAYQHPEGNPGLREWLASYLRGRGVSEVLPGDVMITTGCTQALHLYVSLLVKPGDVVACEVPAYYGLLELLSAAGARILPVPVRLEGGIAIERAGELFEQWKPKLLFSCPTLANPSGATLSEKERLKLVELCRSFGMRIVEDDIYSELHVSGAPKLLRAFDDGSTVSVASSFSKTVAPGLRVGYGLPGDDLYEAFATLKVQQDMHSSTLCEAVLLEFLRVGGYTMHTARLKKRFSSLTQRAMEVMRDSFPKGSEFGPTDGNFMLWAVLPESVDRKALLQKTHEEKVAYCDGDIFYPASPVRPSMRLNCAREPKERLMKALETIGACAHSCV